MDDITIRQVTEDDLDACYFVEKWCFPPREAAPRSNILKRIQIFPEGFLVAEADNRIVGIINSGATHKDHVGDDAFKNMVGHESDGQHVVIFSVGVLPAYRQRGVGIKLIREFIERMHHLEKEKILLICKPMLVPYYEHLGFVDRGASTFKYAGGEWHEMVFTL